VTLTTVGVMLGSCRRGPAPDPQQPPPGVGGNVLLIIADDLGIEQVSAYGHPSAVHTPNIDALAERGVRFDNAYTYTFCSPTRSAMLTGRIGRRTGIGKITTQKTDTFTLSTQAPSIARVVGGQGYETSAVGKWHLSAIDDFDHPNEMGFDWYAGSLKNPQDHTDNVRGKTDYFRWQKVTNGKPRVVKSYMTTDSADDALERIESMQEPWFLWLAFNAPHYPAHIPPKYLHEQPGIRKRAPVSYKFRAAAQALDTEIGRLLDDMDPAVKARTTVIFMSDNGTPDLYAYPPFRWDRGKGYLYEGGIHVPFIVAGPAVTRPGSRTQVWIHAVDVFTTIAELAGADLSTERNPEGDPVEFDGRSFLPWVRNPSLPNDRRYMYGEHYEVNGPPPHRRDDRTVRDEKYKLIRKLNKDMFFELPELMDRDGNLYSTGLDEGDDLLADGLNPTQRAAYERLSEELDAYFAARPFEGY
jgi:arylsulfatase A-like enzyme